MKGFQRYHRETRPEDEAPVDGTGSMPKCDYIPHLDGLRAFALLGVLGFHFNVVFMRGGFLGVDCFLVLSGYLISRNIFRAMECGTFELMQFYKTRFWRLYPASLVTTLASLALSSLILPPNLARETCLSALASSLSVSNFFFLTRTGYFDSSSSLKPLLHTWSLSLEEQFYFVWPTVLLLVNRFGKQRNKLLILSCIVCILLSVACIGTYSKKDQSGFFFLLHGRAWEFCFGSLVFAMSEEVPFLNSPALEYLYSCVITSNIIACIGSVFIAASFFFVHENSPVIFALPVVIGTALILLTPGTVFNRIFYGNSLSRSAGKRAYSIYLVHWPLYVFMNFTLKALGMIHFDNFVVYSLLSFSLGAILFTAVEQKFRTTGRKNVSGRHIFLVSFLLGVVLLLSGYGVITKGWSFRTKQNPKKMDYLWISSNCKLVLSPPKALMKVGGWGPGCVLGNGHAGLNESTFDKSTVDMLLIGNSFTMSILPAFISAVRGTGKTVLVSYKTRCSLLARSQRHNSFCQPFNEHGWKVIEGLRENSTVVLHNSYTSLDTARKVAEELKTLNLRLVVVGAPGGFENKEIVSSCIGLISLLDGMKMSYFLPSKPYQFCDTLSETASALQKNDNELYEAFKAGKETYRYYSCIRENCFQMSNGKYRCPGTSSFKGVEEILYSDGYHLSYYGALTFTPLIKKLIRFEL